MQNAISYDKSKKTRKKNAFSAQEISKGELPINCNNQPPIRKDTSIYCPIKEKKGNLWRTLSNQDHIVPFD